MNESRLDSEWGSPTLDDVSSHGELIEWVLGEHKKFKKYVLPRVCEYEIEAGNA
jgi:hypothetical protein